MVHDQRLDTWAPAARANPAALARFEMTIAMRGIELTIRHCVDELGGSAATRDHYADRSIRASGRRDSFVSSTDIRIDDAAVAAADDADSGGAGLSTCAKMRPGRRGAVAATARINPTPMLNVLSMSQRGRRHLLEPFEDGRPARIDRSRPAFSPAGCVEVR